MSGTPKMFLILFRNSLCPQQMFPSLRAQGNIMSSNVSATMCPRLPVPLGPVYTSPANLWTDKNLHSSTLRLHGTGGTGRIFERLSVQVWDLKKAGQLFHRHGSIFVRTNFCTDEFCSWTACLHGSVQILLQWCLHGSVQSLDQLRHLIPGHNRAI